MTSPTNSKLNLIRWTLIHFDSLDTDTFVQKVEGKNLSTNDFTDELKTKLEAVDEDAQENIIEGITINGTSAAIDTDTKIASLEISAGGMSFVVGSVAPENPNTLWLDTSEHENN